MMTKKTLFFVLTTLVLSSLTTLAQTLQVPSAEAAKTTAVPQLLWRASGLELIGTKVVNVQSGDTITILRNGITYSFKLLAIDAPDSGQPIFDNSRETLSKLVDKKDVKIAVQAQYSNGTFVGTLYRNGRDIGLKQLEKGMAWYLRRDAEQLTDSVKKTYLDAQTYAASAGVGLWAEDRPIPPWVYRGEDLATDVKIAEPETKTLVMPPDRPMPSSNGHTYILGPRGGCYYIAESGRRVYAKDKRLCSTSMAVAKP